MLHRSHKHARPGRSGGRVTVLIVTMLIFGLTASAALGVNPHFIGGQTNAVVNANGSLTVNFKEAGLGDNVTVTITATATGTANWFCVNRGSANPQASNKRTSVATVEVSGDFTSDQNGNVVGSHTLAAPGLPADFSCPGGQSLELGSVTWTNVSVTDETNGITFPIPGTFSTGCLLPGVRFNKVSCT